MKKIYWEKEEFTNFMENKINCGSDCWNLVNWSGYIFIGFTDNQYKQLFLCKEENRYMIVSFYGCQVETEFETNKFDVILNYLIDILKLIKNLGV